MYSVARTYSVARPWRSHTTLAARPATSAPSSSRTAWWSMKREQWPEELGLPQWWLNEQASVYVAVGGDPAARRVFDHPGLRVAAASLRSIS